MTSPQPTRTDAGREAHRGEAGEKVGVFESHRWLIPATVLFCIIAGFAAMVLLTWAAGGGTPFGD